MQEARLVSPAAGVAAGPARPGHAGPAQPFASSLAPCPGLVRAVSLRLSRPFVKQVAKGPGSPIALRDNVLRTFCGSHEMFLEHFWLGLSCFNTSDLCSKNIVFVLRSFSDSQKISW